MHLQVNLSRCIKLIRAGTLAMLLVILQSVSMTASATPVFVKQTLNDLDVSVEHSLLGLQAMAFIKNNELEAVFCDVTFINGPELPVIRKESIKPGVKKVIEATMRRGIVKLTIEVVCKKK